MKLVKHVRRTCSFAKAEEARMQDYYLGPLIKRFSIAPLWESSTFGIKLSRSNKYKKENQKKEGFRLGSHPFSLGTNDLRGVED